MKRLHIAMVAHAINLAYCASLGDTSGLAWADAPQWQHDSALAGVDMHLANPDATPEQSHESWLAQKVADGWVYGEVKDAEKKQHPCCVPYAELPADQKAKDYLFRAAVHALKDIPDAEEAVALALALAPSQGLEASAGVAPPSAGLDLVRYIGRRESWTDNLYESGLTFVIGQARAVPHALSRKLLRHADMFETAVADAAPLDDTLALLEQGKKDKVEKDERENDYGVIDQINQMSKKSLIEYSQNKFGIKLDNRKQVAELRAEVTSQVARFGAA